MDVIKDRRLSRQTNIARILKTLTEAEKKKKIIDLKLLAMEVSSELGLTLRTAKEYIKIALFKKNGHAK